MYINYLLKKKVNLNIKFISLIQAVAQIPSTTSTTPTSSSAVDSLNYCSVMNDISLSVANILLTIETLTGNVQVHLGSLVTNLFQTVENLGALALKSGASLQSSITNLLKNISNPSVKAVLAPALQTYAKQTGTATSAFFTNSSMQFKEALGSLNKTTPLVFSEIFSIVNGMFGLVQTSLDQGHPKGHFCHLTYSKIMSKTTVYQIQQYTTVCASDYHYSLNFVINGMSSTIKSANTSATNLIQSIDSSATNLKSTKAVSITNKAVNNCHLVNCLYIFSFYH